MEKITVKENIKMPKILARIAIPYLIKELIKKIYLLFISTMSIYNKNSLYEISHYSLRKNFK